MERNRDLRRGSPGHRLNEFGRCWRWLVGRQSAWQEEMCIHISPKKRTVPQRAAWRRKHLLFGQTQICFPLQSVEIFPKSPFERGPPPRSRSLRRQGAGTTRQVVINQPPQKHTLLTQDIKTTFLSLGSFAVYLRCKITLLLNDGGAGQPLGSGPLLFSDGAL